MAFSEVLQFGTSLFGMVQAGQQYRDGLADKYRALQAQKDMAAFNMGSYQDALRAQAEENAYRRALENSNRLTAQNERNWQMGQYGDYLDQLLSERQYGIDRQNFLDRTEASNRAYELQQLLRNQQLSAQERRFALEQLAVAQEIARSERDFTQDIYSDEAERLMQRQRLADEQAAEIQEYRLRQARQNQDILADERAFAREMLGYAQDTAMSERDFELAKLAADEQILQNERNFFLDQYDAYNNQLRTERDDELAIREMVMQGAGSLQSDLERMASELGYVPEVREVTPEMIDAEVSRRTGEYISDVDRAAEMVASANEADLIRAGIDVSTTGTNRRGEVAGRLAQEYQNARQRAYDDALGYITGQNQAMNGQIDAMLNRRSALIGEAAGIGATELGYLSNLKAAPSAAGGYQMATYAPSTVLNRNVVSANNYSAPVSLTSALYNSGLDAMTSGVSNYDYNLMNLASGIKSAGNYTAPVGIGSAIYDKALSSGYGSTLSPTSGATTAYNNIGSAIYNPYSMTLQNPSNYLTGYTNANNSLINSYMGNYNAGVKRLTSASEDFGGTLMDFSKNYLDDYMAEKFPSIFG